MGDVHAREHKLVVKGLIDHEHLHFTYCTHTITHRKGLTPFTCLICLIRKAPNKSSHLTHELNKQNIADPLIILDKVKGRIVVGQIKQ